VATYRRHMTDDNTGTTDDVPTTECDHDGAELQHCDKHGTEVEFWIACHDCDVFWTLTGDLERETAHISRDEVEA